MNLEPSKHEIAYARGEIDSGEYLNSIGGINLGSISSELEVLPIADIEIVAAFTAFMQRAGRAPKLEEQP